MVIAKSKKTKSQINNTLKNMDYTWNPGPEPPSNQDAAVPRAIFIPHANSLPFEERRITLVQPVKIGRNVYRATPSPTNAIFECRVLSRHHATIYYDKGHFYLVDNQSSNGTFINNSRCSISKDHEPHEVFSGDIVQFGISVVENAGNTEKNTFPPVVALLKLYHPDGKEAKLSFNTTMTPLHLKELYQLNNFVQEAVQREASLESRLRTLRECVERTRAEAQASWELFVGEQRLLMRVHTLESMLAVGKQPELQHVTQLLNDKKNYQKVAQESLRAAHEQRLALEESLERRSREAAALHHHNCALRLAANNALAELQKLAARCERKMCAARLAISAAEEREASVRAQLPMVYSVQNGEAKMLVLSTDSNRAGDARRSTFEEAIRALPDYVKLLLPPQLLNKVGIKAVSGEGKSAKEFELILQKNNIYDTEIKEKQENEESGVASTDVTEVLNETVVSSDLCTDDEKQLRLNHDGEESCSPLDGELCPDNNANSTYSDSAAVEDSPSKTSAEYANVLRVMSGLNEEIRALRARLTASVAENDQLRAIRDELLAAAPTTEMNNAEPDALALPGDDEESMDFRARIADLQAQLTRTNVAEEANLAEIQRLTSSTAELQAELAFRPTRADVDDLTAVVGKLHSEIQAKNEQIERLMANEKVLLSKETETTGSLEDLRSEEIDAGKIDAVIDEMFRLDDDDDEDTDSAATEVITSRRDDSEEVTNVSQLEEQPSNLSVSDYVKLDDEQRLEVTLSNGSLHMLEEELVRAKEKWAEANAEKARLAAQLAVMEARAGGFGLKICVLVVPVLAAALYWMLLPYIS